MFPGSRPLPLADGHHEIDVRSTDIVEPGDTIRISRRLC